MGYGFSAVNEGGVVQIDSEFSNFEIIQKGVAHDPHPWRTQHHYVGAGDGSNMVFVRPPYYGAEIAYYGVYPGGDSGNFIYPAGTYFVLNYVHGWPNFPNADYVDYAVASRSDAFNSSGTSDYGLRVWNSEENLVYDSGLPYIKIVGVVYATYVTYNPYPYIKTRHDIHLPPPQPGKKYYVGLNNLGMSLWTTYRYSDGSRDTDDYGYTAMFLSETHVVIYTQAWVSGDNPGFPPSTTVREYDYSHTPTILIAEI